MSDAKRQLGAWRWQQGSAGSSPRPAERQTALALAARSRNNNAMHPTYSLQPVGILHSPYREKFGIPRQPGLAPHALATVTLLPPYNHIDSVRGLDSFSHVWLIFAFHQTAEHGWRPTVRPPRLGGNARVGVFASRSTFRPNPLGLSVAELLGIDTEHGVVLRVGGVDLLDGTPILDIKPYIPFVDSQPQARGGFVDGPPATLAVTWSAAAAAAVQRHQARHPELAALIEEVLAQDPRPAYQDDPAREYGVRLHDYNIRFRIDSQCACVLDVIDTCPHVQGTPAG